MFTKAPYLAQAVDFHTAARGHDYYFTHFTASYEMLPEPGAVDKGKACVACSKDSLDGNILFDCKIYIPYNRYMTVE